MADEKQQYRGASASQTGLSSLRDEAAGASSPKASIPSAFSDVARMLPEGLAWSYKATVRAGRVYHQWELTGDRGGIHVHAVWSPSPWSDRNWIGGIEGHSPIPHEYSSDQPSHNHCWLIGGPCWHDGSSLQFSEEIAPYLPFQNGPMGEYEHSAVLTTMLQRYKSWLPTASAIEARRAATAQTGAVHESAAPEGGDAHAQ